MTFAREPTRWLREPRRADPAASALLRPLGPPLFYTRAHVRQGIGIAFRLRRVRGGQRPDRRYALRCVREDSACSPSSSLPRRFSFRSERRPGVPHTPRGAPPRSGTRRCESGFVNDVHAEGVVNGAIEIYHLNGALPETTFQVTILFYVADPTCASHAARVAHDDPHHERCGRRKRPLHIPSRAPVDAADERDHLGVLDPGGRRVRDRAARHSRSTDAFGAGPPVGLEAAPPFVLRLPA